MERGYAQDWPKNFLPRTAYCTHTESEGVLVTAETPNNARWNLVDALAFRVLPHFRFPTDPVLPVHIRDASPTVLVVYEDDEDLPGTVPGRYGTSPVGSRANAYAAVRY
jgi:Putative peptidase family